MSSLRSRPPGLSCPDGAVNYNRFAVIGNTVSNSRYFHVGGYLRL
jgi:hypothetical protein